MDTDELRNNLDYLSLPYLRDEHQNLLAAAVKKNVPLPAFFEQIIAGETAGKRERTIARRIQQAHFPSRKTIAAFDWTYPTKINEELVRYTFNLDFAGKKGNVAFLGTVGTGKTRSPVPS